MDPSYPWASFQSSRVLWGYISLTHWHSWAGKSFSSRSSWDDWCKYAAAESRHWHHHHTDPVNESERGTEAHRDVPSHLWLTFIFVIPHVFKQFPKLLKHWVIHGGSVMWERRGECAEVFLDIEERDRSASDNLWCTVYCMFSVGPHMISICIFLIDTHGRH